MKLTIDGVKAVHCSRCGGSGRLPAFQHVKAGTCFRCQGCGVDPVGVPVVRDMTDDEVLQALAAQGLPVVITTPTGTGDWLGDLFTSGEAMTETMKAARLLLAAL